MRAAAGLAIGASESEEENAGVFTSESLLGGFLFPNRVLTILFRVVLSVGCFTNNWAYGALAGATVMVRSHGER